MIIKEMSVRKYDYGNVAINAKITDLDYYNELLVRFSVESFRFPFSTEKSSFLHFEVKLSNIDKLDEMLEYISRNDKLSKNDKILIKKAKKNLHSLKQPKTVSSLSSLLLFGSSSSSSTVSQENLASSSVNILNHVTNDSVDNSAASANLSNRPEMVVLHDNEPHEEAINLDLDEVSYKECKSIKTALQEGDTYSALRIIDSLKSKGFRMSDILKDIDPNNILDAKQSIAGHLGMASAYGDYNLGYSPHEAAKANEELQKIVSLCRKCNLLFQTAEAQLQKIKEETASFFGVAENEIKDIYFDENKDIISINVSAFFFLTRTTKSIIRELLNRENIDFTILESVFLRSTQPIIEIREASRFIAIIDKNTQELHQIQTLCESL